MGNRKTLKGDGEALKYDRAALNGSKEVLNVVEDTLKDDEKVLKGDGEELKGVLLFYCIYIHVKVDSFLLFYLDDNGSIVTFACYKKLMVRVNIVQKFCITFS